MVVYLDDILVNSKNTEEYAKHLRLILKRLRKHQLFAKASKCTLHINVVEFLGQWVMPEGAAPIVEKSHKVHDWCAQIVLRMSDPSCGLQTITASLSLGMLALHPH